MWLKKTAIAIGFSAILLRLPQK